MQYHRYDSPRFAGTLLCTADTFLRNADTSLCATKAKLCAALPLLSIALHHRCTTFLNITYAIQVLAKLLPNGALHS